jgi:type VI secretion system protein ImpK
MNEFERQIREAISVARTGAQHAEQSLTSPIWQAKSSMASMSGLLPKGRTRKDSNQENESDDTPEDTPETEHSGSNDAARATASDAFLRSPMTRSGRDELGARRVSIERPGISHGLWQNPYIAAAMPLLLLVERLRGQRALTFEEARSQIVRELQHFQQNMIKAGKPPEDISNISYLLCTYIDAILSDKQATMMSLLVEFHRDAWGGENCFEHLQTYMEAPQRNRELLEFYDLILSLGFEGKYQIEERGSALLLDLRTHLNSLLYGHNPTQYLTVATSEGVTPRRRRLKAIKVLLCGLLLCLVAYGITAWYLHEQARKIRSDILAWVPPEPRKINIMETLPNPLSQILNEGWLEVRKDPRGWLLIFTSDGAFRTGEAQLSESFLQKRNIERLGAALAPWPGDLEVIGHTDNQPFRNTKVNSNLKLSEARAQVVADKLRESTNINQTHQREISSIGRGENEPLADNSTDEGRRRNRRVDILWKIGQREADEAMKDFLEQSPVISLPVNKQ